MQAAVYKPGSPTLHIVEDYPIPEVRPHEVLLKIQACGVCHTDVFLLSQFADDPRSYILGHEISGIAVKLGAGVDSREIHKGGLYAVLGVGGCVRCAHIAKPSAAPVGLTSADLIGIGKNGGYAEYIAVSQENLVHVPKNVSAIDAAVVADAGITAYHAVHRVANVKKGEKVLIIGIGGLGLLAVQFAKHFGAEVYVLDIRPTSRAIALEFGAKAAFSHVELDAQLAKGFTVDIVIDFVATNSSFSKAFASVQNNVLRSDFSHGGKIVLVGASDEVFPVAGSQFIITNVSILTSLYGTREDMEEVLELIAQGIIRTAIQAERLADVNRVLDELRANLVLSRKVVVPPHSEHLLFHTHETAHKLERSHYESIHHYESKHNYEAKHHNDY